MSEGTRYLTLAEVIAQHEWLMREYGQESILLDEGRLDAAVARPRQAAFDEGATLVRQAALLLHGIVQAHPFMDGNKRLALLACVTFLRLNRREIVAEPLEVANAMLACVVEHAADPLAAADMLAAWLEQHSRSAD